MTSVFFENFNNKSDAENKADYAYKENEQPLVVIKFVQEEILRNNEHYYRDKK